MHLPDVFRCTMRPHGGWKGVISPGRFACNMWSLCRNKLILSHRDVFPKNLMMHLPNVLRRILRPKWGRKGVLPGGSFELKQVVILQKDSTFMAWRYVSKELLQRIYHWLQSGSEGRDMTRSVCTKAGGQSAEINKLYDVQLSLQRALWCICFVFYNLLCAPRDVGKGK